MREKNYYINILCSVKVTYKKKPIKTKFERQKCEKKRKEYILIGCYKVISWNKRKLSEVDNIADIPRRKGTKSVK